MNEVIGNAPAIPRHLIEPTSWQAGRLMCSMDKLEEAGGRISIVGGAINEVRLSDDGRAIEFVRTPDYEAAVPIVAHLEDDGNFKLAEETLSKRQIRYLNKSVSFYLKALNKGEAWANDK